MNNKFDLKYKEILESIENNIVTLFNLASSKQLNINELKDFLYDPDNNVNVNSLGDDNNTLLMLAAYSNNIKLAEVLLQDSDIDVNIQDKNGNTALIWAVSTKSIPIIKLLLKYSKTNINIKNKKNKVAIDFATPEIKAIFKKYNKGE